jgi:hypothetical protein
MVIKPAMDADSKRRVSAKWSAITGAAATRYHHRTRSPGLNAMENADQPP